MDWNRIEGNWKQFKGKIKEQWGHLTDDDLDKIAASATNSLKGRFRNAPASPKTRRARVSTTG